MIDSHWILMIWTFCAPCFSQLSEMIEDPERSIKSTKSHKWLSTHMWFSSSKGFHNFTAPLKFSYRLDIKWICQMFGNRISGFQPYFPQTLNNNLSSLRKLITTEAVPKLYVWCTIALQMKHQGLCIILLLYDVTYLKSALA